MAASGRTSYRAPNRWPLFILLPLLFYVNFIHIWFSSSVAGIVMHSLIMPCQCHAFINILKLIW
uniref:Uncharacterized protein n=1 Tax=Glossina palpalis gambiensis TaxID=67801 RepID=A0A1B0B1G0_9MUSC